MVDPDHAEREIAVGVSAAGRALVVVFLEESDGTIRIISARKANRHERQDYEEG